MSYFTHNLRMLLDWTPVLHISIYANYSKDFTSNFGSKLAAFVCLAVKRGETFLNWKQSKICLWVARSDLARGETVRPGMRSHCGGYTQLHRQTHTYPYMFMLCLTLQKHHTWSDIQVCRNRSDLLRVRSNLRQEDW